LEDTDDEDIDAQPEKDDDGLTDKQLADNVERCRNWMCEFVPDHTSSAAAAHKQQQLMQGWAKRKQEESTHAAKRANVEAARGSKNISSFLKKVDPWAVSAAAPHRTHSFAGGHLRCTFAFSFF